MHCCTACTTCLARASGKQRSLGRCALFLSPFECFLTATAALSSSCRCRREGLSLLALQAVRSTSDAVLSALLRRDLREGFWDSRNQHCTAALSPARAADRPVRSDLASVCDPVGDGVKTGGAPASAAIRTQLWHQAEPTWVLQARTSRSYCGWPKPSSPPPLPATS